ncbi:MAG: methylated-DNA--[protein]-cysteine S-methyltransferase [Chloroflexota bacterium]
MSDLERRLASSTPAGDLDMARLRAGLGERAAAAHLLDVAYATLDSPLGELTVFVTPRGVVRVAFADEPRDAILDEMAARLSPRVLAAARPTDEARRQLDAYLSGERRAFDLPLDWTLIRGFAIGILRATAAVPYGSTSTYRDVAVAAGSPRGARAAGNALGSNPIPIIVPCHRILHASGGLGGYAGGLDRKRTLLRLEGVLPA